LLIRALPDITSDIYAESPSTLQWVGMDNIGVPIKLDMQDQAAPTVIANASVYVSLDDSSAKGIHMSRLHNLINQLATLECSKENLMALLDKMVVSQQGLSEHANIELSFNLLLQKPALSSSESGYQSYPLKLKAQKHAQSYNFDLELTIPYSSTCPCSASLSRQLYAQAIDQIFNGETIEKSQLLAWIQSDKGSIATPHSQRSYAYLQLTLNQQPWPDISALIFELESVISTPVQTAVKRVDEQEFARLNATNLMFCEDAARRLKQALEQMPYVKSYWCKVEHQESLHAHNAIAITHSR